MKKKENFIKTFVILISVTLFSVSAFFFSDEFLSFGAKVALFSLRAMLPHENTVAEVSETTTAEVETTEKVTEKEEVRTVSAENAFSKTPDDILKLMEKEKANSSKLKKDKSIIERQYINEGVTDKHGLVRMKNVNNTKVSLKDILEEKIDLSVEKDKPAVLIFHTHTTETYQLLDVGFYPKGFQTRTNDKGKNMVRVGEAICEEIEKAGFKVIHDKEIHDSKYTGAYGKSRETVESYMKKYPSIQITLDIHRDAIQNSDGTKIKPTAEIKGKKAAQIMIISGCQEEGNPITNLPDWRYNLTFAVHLQQKLEEFFEGITRPLYFCPRSYNMNVSHCSLLVEVGSDSNTLEEAVYTGKCIGTAVAEILEEYEE